MRTRFFLLLLLALPAAPAFAQSNEEKLAEKMSHAFVSRVAWETSWDKARERAEKEGKLILGYFTRSFQP